MYDQVIDLKTAKLAKEKGFNWGVDKHYEESLTRQEHPEDGTSGPFGWEKGEINLQSGYHINNHETDFSNKSWGLYAAPTQSFLQRWLREEKCIDLFVVPALREGAYEWLIVLEEDTKRIEADGYHHVYEDALEEGLVTALKQLKDV